MSRGQDSSTNDQKEGKETTESLSLGPEKTTTLSSPIPFSIPSSKVTFRAQKDNFRTFNATTSDNHDRQNIGQSQHTEIEFYSSDDEADDEGEGSFFDSEDNSSNENFEGQVNDSRYKSLQRAASRQSFQSVASDAFSLPLESQDDVSSLECDHPGNANSGDHDDADDISLEAENFSISKRNPPTAPVGLVDFFDSPKRDRPTISDRPRHPASREAYGAKKNQINALHMSFSSQSGLDQLPEEVEEDDNDDGDDKSVKIRDLLAEMNLEGSSHRNDELDTTWRLHKSLFLPRDGSSFFLPVDAPSPNGTPRSRYAQRLATRTASLVVDDISFDLLAKNLPPELDFHEARKYIIQLSQGVAETPGKESIDHRTAPPSAAKSSAMDSEYTEVIIDDDGNEENPFQSPRLLITPQTSRRLLLRNNPRESLQSYDFTEIVEESGDDEVVIEEEIIEEEEETDFLYEEEDDCDDAKPAALGVIAGMVNAT